MSVLSRRNLLGLVAGIPLAGLISKDITNRFIFPKSHEIKLIDSDGGECWISEEGNAHFHYWIFKDQVINLDRPTVFYKCKFINSRMRSNNYHTYMEDCIADCRDSPFFIS